MRDFEYYAPTKVFFGKEKHKEVGKIISEYGYKTIMLQYGKYSIKRNGIYDDVMSSLNEYGITVVEMGGVEPNPKVSFVRKAVDLARENNVEMIINGILEKIAQGYACAKREWKADRRNPFKDGKFLAYYEVK